MQKPSVSIIIPIYNAENTLRRCLDSILTQTYTDWELILIDDGSNDSSGSICEEYAEKDSRILVYHKENGGVSSARNCGLDNASGEWIGWVDSDDYVEPGFLQNFMELPQESDLLQQGFHSTNWYNNSGPTNISSSDATYKGEELLPYIINLIYRGQFPFLWCKLFKKSIVEKHQIRFDENVHFQEDYLFIAKYMTHITAITNSSKYGVCYEFPQMYTKYKKRTDYLSVYKKAYEYLLRLAINRTTKDDLQVLFADRLTIAFLREKDKMGISACVSIIKWIHQHFEDDNFRAGINSPFWKILNKVYGSNQPLECIVLYLNIHLLSKIKNIIALFRKQ